MEVFTAHIAPEGIAALHSLISATIQVIFSPMIAVGATSIRAGSFSIPLRGRYLTIENTTKETVTDRVDYHCIQVSLADLPKDIPVEMNGRKVRLLGRPVSSISWDDPPLNVVQVDVFQHDETWPDYVDRVVYDVAVVIHARGGQK